MDPHKIQVLGQCLTNNPNFHEKINVKRFTESVFAFEKKERRRLAPKDKNLLLGSCLIHPVEIMKDPLLFDWLKTAITVKDIKHASDTLLYWLTTSNSGASFLSHLFDKHYKIFSKIPLALLFAVNEEKPITSAFYWLTSTNEGQSLVLKLAQSYAPFFDSTMAIALTSPSPSSEGCHANLSPFYNFVLTDHGLTVLVSILEKKPELVEYCPLNRTIDVCNGRKKPGLGGA
jgi:hypothetical protein